MEKIILPLIGLVLIVAVILVIREIVMWYWKINAIIDNQERTNTLLDRQNQLMEAVLNRSSVESNS